MSTSPRIGKIAAAAGIAAAALLGTGGTAVAAPAAGTEVVLRPAVSQDRVLTVSGPSGQFGPSLGVAKLSGQPGATQRWKLVPAGPGVVTIENNAFGRLCVDVDPLPNVTIVFPSSCDGSAAQKWDIQTSVGGQRIRNAGTGQVMVANVNEFLSFGLVFEQPQASTTPGRLQQAWNVS